MTVTVDPVPVLDAQRRPGEVVLGAELDETWHTVALYVRALDAEGGDGMDLGRP